MSGGGGGGQNTQTIQKSDPWPGQQSFLTDLFAKAQQQQQSSNPQYYPGQSVAPQSPLIAQGQQRSLQELQGVGQAANQFAAPLAQAGAQNYMFDTGAARYAESNPYLQSTIQAAQKPVIQAFTDPGGPLSQARMNYNQAGQFGSSRHAITEGILGGRLADSLAGQAAALSNQNYQTAGENAVRQQALLPQLMQSQLMPAQAQVGQGALMQGIGGQNSAYAQQLIDAAMQKWNFEQNLPAAKLGQYGNLIQGSYGGQQNTIQTGPQSSINPWLASLGGAASGAAVGATAGPALGAAVGTTVSPGIGTAAGAGIGALLAYLGSR